jgi:hypothetical protein
MEGAGGAGVPMKPWPKAEDASRAVREYLAALDGADDQENSV